MSDNTQCRAAEIEASLASHGYFDGKGGTYFISRPITIKGISTVTGVNVRLTPEAQAKADAEDRASREAETARETERQHLRDLGVAFLSDLPD